MKGGLKVKSFDRMIEPAVARINEPFASNPSNRGHSSIGMNLFGSLVRLTPTIPISDSRPLTIIIWGMCPTTITKAGVYYGESLLYGKGRQ